ncbi:hypothetical protein CJO94_19650 (plasmid) [Ralstonia solanacearum]|nr:hypothetical protein CJO94_19650 [Ralstonia solanacearum]
MTNRILSDLEETLLDPASADPAVPHPDYTARCQELAAGYHALRRRQEPDERPLRAYLLLDIWDGNPLAAQLSEAWPEAAAGRAAVPDDFYAGREGEAPCLVPLPDSVLPDGATDNLAEVRAQEALARLLEAASRQASQRLVRQHFCAVLFSTDSAAWVARYLASLGFQYPPGSSTARLFRYQDPRAMQRVWPVLSAAQQGMWLGAVEAWWSLTQPWGPWAMEDLVAADDTAVPAPPWFKAERPVVPDGQTETLMLSRLMNAEQWWRAHSSPVGNRVWARFAQRGISSQAQPDAKTMAQLLGKGQELGLTDSNLQDFVWCSWQPGLQNAPDGAIGRSIEWDEPHWRDVLTRVLQGLRDDPDAGFAGVFEEHKHFA